MVAAIEHTEISEKVYRILKHMILNREFSGGQKLDLKDLSSRMKISRTPLKDALQRLLSEGLVVIKPRSGTIVTAITTADIVNIMEVRMMIELWCISLLDEKGMSILAEKLSVILKKSKKIIEAGEFSYDSFMELDIQFHMAIVMMNSNPKLMDMYASLNSFLYIFRILYFQNFDRSVNGQVEHESIYRHVRSFEKELVGQAIKQHIENSKKNMISIIEENGGSI